MRKLIFIILAAILMMPGYAYGEDSASRHVGKVLFIGDSMTGWLSERLEAYGAENGFEVTTVTWDGSTPQKWAKTGKQVGVFHMN